MSIVDFIFPVATLALSVALWSCWRSGKPAREAAAAKREQAYRDHLAEAQKVRDRQFAADVIRVLDEIVAGKIDAERSDYGSSGREFYKFPAVKLLQQLKGDREVIDRILGRADRTHARIDELTNQLHEVHSVLRVYHPRTSPPNEFPTIRKG